MTEAALATTKDLDRFQQLRGRPAMPHAYVVLLGLNEFDLPSLLKLIEAGFAWKTFERFARNLGLDEETVGDVLGIPRRTLARRKVERHLKADESDRLLRLARVFGSALDLFDGNRDAATEWLTDVNNALGGFTPLDFARTEIGAGEVENLVSQIQYGIVS
jgi:putative toxin-antitoxin system antitoxin component (TIGR02293 family)